MKTFSGSKAVLIVSLMALSSLTFAQNQPANRADDAPYGSQLMTEQERMEVRNKMRAAGTKQERDRIRLEHHRQMQERAKAQGIVLPDKLPAQKGQGMGMGKGKGGS